MNRKRSRRLAAGAALALMVTYGGETWNPQVRAQSARQPSAVDALEVVQIRPDFYMLVGAGGNIAVQIGPMGVILVDTGTTMAADRVLATVKRLTDKSIRYIINTAADADHVGGNDILSKAGMTILGGTRGNASFTGNIADAGDLNGGLATVFAHENVLATLSGSATPQPSGLWPSKTYTDRGYSMSLNGEAIQVFYQPAAHSDGDSVVVFRHSDVVVTGDIVDINRFPVIDTKAGGTIQGEIDALNRVLDMVVPPFPLAWQEGRTLVVPGHGRPLDFVDLEDYRDMVTIMRNVIQDMVSRGMTLAQVKAADPTKAYRTRYGATSGAWTTDMFVEAIYNGLTPKKSRGAAARREQGAE